MLALSEVNDALALAKPIVMTRIGAIDFDPEVVGGGFTVAPGEWPARREAMTLLDGDPPLRARLGRRGRESAEGHHTRIRSAPRSSRRSESHQPATEKRVP